MSVKPFRRTQTLDKDVRLLQDSVDATLRTLTSLSILNGKLVQGLDLSSGDNVVDHGLDRSPQGYFIVRSDAHITIYDKQEIDEFPNRQITLNASAAARVDIWIY